MNIQKPVVFLILDGFGHREEDDGNAIKKAYTPTYDYLLSHPHIYLNAHGTAVGLPSDKDMGNSEVGHNAIGCGQIYAQGALRANEAIDNKDIWQTDMWNKIVTHVVDAKSTLHLIGLLSDGNIHSHINHLKALIAEAKKEHISTVKIHALLDGRDVLARSALTYIKDIEDFLLTLNDENFYGAIASGGGRMTTTMDRYEADWSIVKRGWDAHVLGKARGFSSATKAVETYRNELNVDDQNLPSFVIVDENNTPIGPIYDDDAVIFFNFRGDRAIELSQAFDNEHFDKFDRERYPSVIFAGLLEYDSDAKIPKNFLVSPSLIEHTLTERLIEENIRQIAISETQKFGHVTYFWNGNRVDKFSNALETYVEIPSDTEIFSKKPWMKSDEIAEEVIKAIQSKKYGFIRANFPNGDMVGHTGHFLATIIGVESVDLALERILVAVDEHDCILVVTADHGNAEEMLTMDAENNTVAKTSHTLSKVPFIIYNKKEPFTYKIGDFGLSNIASTICDLLGVAPYPVWKESVIDVNDK